MKIAQLNPYERMQLFESTYEKNLQWIPETNGKCGLNPDKILTLLQRVDKILGNSMAKCIGKILDSTEYISYERLLKLLDKAMDSFISEIGKQRFGIVISSYWDGNRYSSEEYIIQLMWHKLRKLNLEGIYYYKDNIQNVDTVLWLDDISYSGGNMSEVLTNLSVKNVHILLAAASRSALQYSKTITENFNLYQHVGMKLESMNDRYGDSADILDSYFWQGATAIPAYLDYKIASSQSTYYHLYTDGHIPHRSFTDKELMMEPSDPPGEDIGHLTYVLPSRNIISVLQQYHNSL